MSSNWEDDLTEGDVTVGASSDAIAEIRQTAKQRGSDDADGGGGDGPVIVIKTWTPEDEPTEAGLGDDPTAAGLASEGLVDAEFGDDPTAVGLASAGLVDDGLGDDPTAVGLASAGLVDDGLGDDPTTVMDKAPNAVLGDEPTEAPASPSEPLQSTSNVDWSPQNRPGGGESLAQGKDAPATTVTYWERNEIAVAPSHAAARTRARIPVWFVTVTVLAVAVAVAIVLVLLLLTSGGSA